MLFLCRKLFADEYKQKGAAELLPFVYMVEDKMKKMKNCYLRVL